MLKPKQLQSMTSESTVPPTRKAGPTHVEIIGFTATTIWPEY